MKNINHSYILYMICMFLFPFFSAAQPGSLDTRFGEQGKIYEKDFNGGGYSCRSKRWENFDSRLI